MDPTVGRLLSFFVVPTIHPGHRLVSYCATVVVCLPIPLDVVVRLIHSAPFLCCVWWVVKKSRLLYVLVGAKWNRIVLYVNNYFTGRRWLIRYQGRIRIRQQFGQCHTRYQILRGYEMYARRQTFRHTYSELGIEIGLSAPMADRPCSGFSLTSEPTTNRMRCR